MSINDRIKEARKNKGITQEQLGELIGVAKTTITGYEKNREPSAAKVGEIADALDVDVNYLFQDEVKKLHENRATPLEMEHLVKRYRDLDEHGKEMVDFTLEKETERIKQYGKLGETPRPVTSFPMRLISYYFKNASAGTGQIVIDNLPDKDIEIPDKPKYRNVSYAIGVNGSSMEPVFHDGDILLVETTREIEIGDIGIFQINDECFVKKLGEKELISLNKEYKNIPLDETAITLGKVIDKL